MFNLFKKKTGYSEGFQYGFFLNRALRDNSSPQAGFIQYQTYPENNVQGGGTLVGSHAGKYWNIMSGPQVIQQNQPVISDPMGGGALAGNIIMQPLIDTSKASG